MAFCQACASLCGKRFVNGESVVSISGGHVGPGKGHVSPEARTLLILIVAMPLSHSISPSHAVCLLKKQNPKPKNAMIKEFVFLLHCPLGKGLGTSGSQFTEAG